VPWVPVESVAGEGGYAAPVNLLADPDDRLSDLLPLAFPASYVHRRIGLR
jgi:hypothetical protein